MKKLIVLFLALTSVFALSLNAQNTVTIGDVTALPGPVDIPIDVDFGVVTNTCSFDLTINFDITQLTWVGIGDVASLPGGSVSVSPVPDPSTGQVNLTWFDGTSTGSSLDGVLLNLQFIYAGGNSAISFSAVPGDNELGDCISSIGGISSTFTDGSITESALVPVSNWAIFLGIGLIVVFMAVGMRRYFFA